MPPVSPKRQSIGRVSPRGLAMLAINAGFGSPGDVDDVEIAVAVALAESGGRVRATNRNKNGSVDRGLWQINSIHNFDPKRLLGDPMYNAQAAFKVYSDAGSSFRPWVQFKNGAYKKHMRRARRAVAWATGGSSGTGEIRTELDAGIAQPVVDAFDSAGDVIGGWKNDLVHEAGYVLLRTAMAGTGLALAAYGLVKLTGSSKVANTAKKVAPVAAGVRSAAS